MSKQPLLGQYIISVENAEAWTASWQCEYPDLPKAFRFDKDELNTLMDEEGVEYVRFYFSQKPSGDKTLVAVGVTDEDKDIVEVEGQSMVYDFSKPCPPTCDTNSKLYHDEPC